jgi:hypothetical protein
MNVTKKDFESALTQIREIMSDYKISIDDIKRDLQEGISIPVSIFNSKCSPLGAICVYLKDKHEMGFSEIARKLNRDPRTIWLTYQKNYKNKQKINFDFVIGLNVFSERRLSVMEHLVSNLRDRGLKLTKIADLTGKSPKTIWSFYNRAKKK